MDSLQVARELRHALQTFITSNTDNVWYVDSDGYCGGWDSNETYGIRPALILPSSALVDDDLNVLAA